MCAITGVFRTAGINPSPVTKMARALAHRGPDAHTVRRYGGRKPYAALGVERLAIVDPENGDQPASDPTGRWKVALNGEIYNHVRLRKELMANGVALKTLSDTEMVAGLIATNGLERALQMCHGMFAMAVLDTKARRLFLVRDRMGVKPLHWTALPDNTVAFASEIKGLLAHPQVPRSIDQAAIESYLLFEYIPAPRTIWRGIHKVEPGSWVEVNESGSHTHRWWSPPVGLSGRPGNFERWSKSLHGALQVAVHQRMEADVPVGYLLSGGLDSAAVAMMASRRSSDAIQTFSMKIEAEGFDESNHAAATAAAIGANHTTGSLGAHHLEETVASIIQSMDEPLADSSLVATWRLMELVKASGLKCIQSGDGADETFGGYPTYLAHLLAPSASTAKSPLRRFASKLPVRMNGVTTDYMARRFVDGLGHPWQRRHQLWMGAWLPEEINASEAPWDVVDLHGSRCGKDGISRAMSLDQRLYLPECVLVKVDRAAGAHGLEVRSPFLDHSIVELGSQMGSGHHVFGHKNKRVLREAMKGLLPEDTRTRKKKGFGAPIGPWLRGPCTHMLDDLEDSVAEWIPPQTLRRCIQEHRNGTADHRRRLWTALILSKWRTGPYGTP